MAVPQAPPPDPEKARTPKNPQLPRDPERYFLCLEERLPMAAFALCSVAYATGAVSTQDKDIGTRVPKVKGCWAYYFP